MTDYRPDIAYAAECDANDPLAYLRARFYIPPHGPHDEVLYFCGNSLGLQPRAARLYVEQELGDWAELAVEAHFRGARLRRYCVRIANLKTPLRIVRRGFCLHSVWQCVCR